ncbi:NAD(P)H dehydrogenase (quinone) [Austwickia sp. TVS 96-490-7B]|uniref:NAD(P)H-quinone dehydrogenase n=1 Tax=Austwickia sp. TVS 96-490-7B TaxID=2830843 RepID=UPI001DED096C|nr:NAD(P)H-quinone dehydrogenase [Austwickia sp. TVS 96-490-7B]MBW3084661.1 NAD(P)H dehydrogenase (quinone) [Austwickia sp. TVS 96-490-7B]
MSERTQSVVIIGGGPGGYEAALVAASLNAQVTVIDSDGVGGSCVLTDCVPSKALISTATYVGRVGEAAQMGVRLAAPERRTANDAALDADLPLVNARIQALAKAQSADIRTGLQARGAHVVTGRGRLISPSQVRVTPATSGDEPPAAPYDIDADMILLATGAAPRVMDTAVPDGERILTWQQIWTLTDIPEHLIVVGSGVTGAELAQAYLGMGTTVTLVSSRDHVLPGEDSDAAQVIEDVFRDRGMQVLNRSRMAAVRRDGDQVHVLLDDGREITGSHALLAVGSVPRTDDLGLEDIGVARTERGHIRVDRVSRTSVRGVYAAGDCTGVLPLASVAAMQGRIAVAHALGDAVAPLNIRGVSSTIFTDPEIATVGLTKADATDRDDIHQITMPLATNARAKMDNVSVGFVKLFARAGSNQVVGGVVVAPRASELIFPIALAVGQRLTVDQVASTITVYPSLSGSIAEAARRLHAVGD